MRSTEQEIRQFIIDNFLFGDLETELANDDSLLSRGIIDSTGVLELMTFLEDKYAIKILDDELVSQNLDSVNGLVQFINRKVQMSRTTVAG